MSAQAPGLRRPPSATSERGKERLEKALGALVDYENAIVKTGIVNAHSLATICEALRRLADGEE